jgi:tetratricopeptide (TPR) repeat protein
MVAWLDRIESEHDNFRAAFDWLESSGETQLVLRLAGALSDFWDLRAHLVEGRRRLEAALAGDPAPTRARARALDGAGELAAGTGDIETARTYGEEAVAIHLSLGDVRGAAASQHLLAYVAAEQGDWWTAQQQAEAILVTFADAREEHIALRATRLLAWTCYELGDRDRAKQLHEDNLKRARVAGDMFMHASTLGALATTFALPDGKVVVAASLLRESLPLWLELGDRQGLTQDVSRCAETLLRAGQAEPAAALITWVKTVRTELSFNEPWVTRMIDEVRERVRDQLGEAQFAAAAEHARSLSLDEAVDLALRALAEIQQPVRAD